MRNRSGDAWGKEEKEALGVAKVMYDLARLH